MSCLNMFNLAELIEKFGCKVFFETGSGNGGGIKYASQFPFKSIYSVEIDKHQVEKLSFSFKENHNIKILHGNSTEVLENFFKFSPLEERIIYWLDAHFPSADLGKRKFDDEKDMSIRLPLEKELDLILENRVKKGFKDVILVDDLRIYEKLNYEAKNLDEIGHANLFYPVSNLGEKFLEYDYSIHKSERHTGILMLLPN